jgi:Gene product 88
MKKSTVQVSVKLRNMVLVGIVERVEDSQVYINASGETYKFHQDELSFPNENQKERFEKLFKRKVSMKQVEMALSAGNKKLNDTKAVSFYQWNITSVISCPFRTDMCEKACYALKAEKMYPTVASRRISNLEFSKSAEFVNTMIDQIEFELARKKNAGKTIFFRIHEAGDFYSYEYLAKWHEIASHFKGNRRIVFMAYTKSLPFVKTLYKNVGKQNVNITFKSSIWEDTKPKFIEMTSELGMSIFTAEKKGTLEEKNYFSCPASEAFKNTAKEKNCGDCKVCYIADVDVAIEIH